jgi:tRNA threonylcarbamoyladenosine biosynthesis protein TsaB
MEAYTAIFDAKKNQIREVQAEIITEMSFSEIDSKMYLVGDCLEKCRTVLVNERFIFRDDIEYPSAKDMGILSYDKFTKNDNVDVAYFEPYYLKDFISTVKKLS